MSQKSEKSFKAQLVSNNRDDRTNLSRSGLINSENRPIHGYIMTVLNVFENHIGENAITTADDKAHYHLAFKDFQGLIKIHERLSLEIASGVRLTSDNIRRYESHIGEVLNNLRPIIESPEIKDPKTRELESQLMNFFYFDIVIKDKANQETIDQFITRIKNDILHGVSAHSHSKIERKSILSKIFSEVSESLSGYVGFYDTDTHVNTEEDIKQAMGQSPESVMQSQIDQNDSPKQETYDNRPIGESALDFIKRVYGPRLTGEFTRADLRKIDPQAEMALRNWERSNGRASLNLPTKKERNDALLKRNPETLSEYERQAQNRIKLSRKHHPIRS